MDTIIQDIRYSLRSLMKKPGFSVIAVLTLALGISGNTAIFSIINGVLIKPLPFQEPDRLMALWEHTSDDPRLSFSFPNYLDVKTLDQVFDDVAAIVGHSFVLTGRGDADRISSARVSANFFQVLGVQPAAGRLFVPEDDTPGQGRVVMLSYDFWQNKLGGDPDIIGQSLTLSGVTYTVTGILPSAVNGRHYAFWYNNNDRPIELWVPNGQFVAGWTSRGSHSGHIAIARLKDGVTQAQAAAALDVLAARLEKAYPEENTGHQFVITPFHTALVGESRTPLFMLMAAVGFVLLIACVNVANLLMARATGRRRELAVRMAMGAARFRLMRQLLTESLVLGMAGGVSGLLIAMWGLDILKSMAPAELPRLAALEIDGAVFGFTFILVLLTSLLFGLLPALHASDTDLNEVLKATNRTSAGKRHARHRGVLVSLEVALAVVLLVGAGLLVRSFYQVISVDPGFQPNRLLTMYMALPLTRYGDIDRQTTFFQQMTARINELPGVQTAGAVTDLPLLDDDISLNMRIEGRPEPAPGENMAPAFRAMTPDYFQAMGIPLMSGRSFDNRDQVESMPVAIINQTMAERHFPSEDPIGKRLRIDWGDHPWITIVGVVSNVKQRGLDSPQADEAVYIPYPQRPFQWMRWMNLAVRTEADAAGMISSIRRTIANIDPDIPISNIRTGDQLLAQTLAQRRFLLMLLGVFATVALIMASTGVYGVISYATGQRTREIGIRMALGARKRQVLAMVMGQCFKQVGAGLLIGLIGAFIVSGYLNAFLFNISPLDPMTYAGVVLILAAAALAACYFPALRAAKIEPMTALRHE